MRASMYLFVLAVLILVPSMARVDSAPSKVIPSTCASGYTVLVENPEIGMVDRFCSVATMEGYSVLQKNPELALAQRLYATFAEKGAAFLEANPELAWAHLYASLPKTYDAGFLEANPEIAWVRQYAATLEVFPTSPSAMVGKTSVLRNNFLLR